MKSMFARKPPEPVKRKVNVADPERLAALRRLKILDTPPEESLDRLTRISAKVVGAPVALLTLIDSHRQYFKSAYGLPEPFNTTRETPLTYSFCRHVVEDSAPMIVRDAREDPRTQGNPAIEIVGVIAYAGMPLYAPNGEPLGSFCVMDTRPRDWTQEQLGVLKDLASAVMAELEAREITNLLIQQEETRIGMGEEITDDVMLQVRTLVANLRNAMAAKTVGPAITDAILTTERIGARLCDLSDIASYAPDSLYMVLRRHDIGKLMANTAKELMPLANSLQVKIEISVPKGVPAVLAHEPSMERVLRVLTRQALRLTPVGGTVKMWAEADDKDVICFISNVASTADENLHKAWLVRKDGSEAPHTHIGLAFCERTLEEHGGTIGVASLPDGTSAIRFTLTHVRS